MYYVCMYVINENHQIIVGENASSATDNDMYSPSAITSATPDTESLTFHLTKDNAAETPSESFMSTKDILKSPKTVLLASVYAAALAAENDDKSKSMPLMSVCDKFKTEAQNLDEEIEILRRRHEVLHLRKEIEKKKNMETEQHNSTMSERVVHYQHMQYAVIKFSGDDRSYGIAEFFRNREEVLEHVQTDE